MVSSLILKVEKVSVSWLQIKRAFKNLLVVSWHWKLMLCWATSYSSLMCIPSQSPVPSTNQAWPRLTSHELRCSLVVLEFSSCFSFLLVVGSLHYKEVTVAVTWCYINELNWICGHTVRRHAPVGLFLSASVSSPVYFQPVKAIILYIQVSWLHVLKRFILSRFSCIYRRVNVGCMWHYDSDEESTHAEMSPSIS